VVSIEFNNYNSKEEISFVLQAKPSAAVDLNILTPSLHTSHASSVQNLVRTMADTALVDY
jgi:hypothetical protein